jgi:hypothetical protein
VSSSSAIELTLVNPPTTPFPDDTASFTGYMTQILPHLKVKTVSSDSSAGRRLIKERELHGLPAALFDSAFHNTAFFAQWINAGWIKEIPDGQGYLVMPSALAPQIYFEREKKTNELDIFIMSQCPFGIQALTQILEARQDKKVSEDVRLNVHYLVTRTGESGLPKPPEELKGNPSDYFQSLHGVSELEEDVRELVILKYFPEKFPAYFLERSKQPASSLWENAAAVAQLDPAFISAKYNEEGASLIQKDFALSEELGLNSSPTFLWDNTIRINNVAHLKTFPPLKDLDIQLSGSCNHPKSDH